MKKIKLQVQVTVDGFYGDLTGNLDWHFGLKWSKDLKDYVNNLTDSCDTILLGRKKTEGFISARSSQVEDENNPNYLFARKMVDKPKVVFSKTLIESKWSNTTVVNGELNDEIKKLKIKKGKDIIVYGGTSFVASLIKESLIDELHLFINPVVIGKGTSIFKDIEKAQSLILLKVIGFECGMAVLVFKPLKNKNLKK